MMALRLARGTQVSDNQNDDFDADAQPDDELDINTVDRFTKRADSLILEHHSHCEVPAGCGGVVLRWRDPTEGVPLVIEWFCPHSVELAIDGKPSAGGYLVTPLGPHDLELSIQVRKAAPCLLALSMRSGGPTLGDDAIDELSTHADGTWTWVPADDADAVPTPLEASPVDPQTIEEDRLRWRALRLSRRGAQLLELPDVAVPTTILVRKRITIDESMYPPELP